VIETIAAAVRDASGADSGVSVQITLLGGQLSAVGKSDTAFHHRDAQFEVHGIATWSPAPAPSSKTVEGVEKTAAIRRFSAAMQQHGSAGYVNIHSSTNPAWLEKAYGPTNLKRLQRVKEMYDPENFFHSNPNNAVASGPRAADVGGSGTALSGVSLKQWATVPDSPVLVRLKNSSRMNPTIHVSVASSTTTTPSASTFKTHQPPPLSPPSMPPPRHQSADAGGTRAAVMSTLTSGVGRLQQLLTAKLTTGLKTTPPPLPRSDNGTVYWCDHCMQVIADDPPPFGMGNTRWHSSEGEFDMCNECHQTAANTHPHHLWEEVPLKGLIPFTADASDGSAQLNMGAIVLAVLQNYQARWLCGVRHPTGCPARGHTSTINRNIGSTTASNSTSSSYVANVRDGDASPQIQRVLSREDGPCRQCGLSLGAPSPPNTLVWSTYGEMKTRLVHFSCGLRKHLNLATRSIVGICAANSEEWLVTDLSCIVANLITIPLDPPANKSELQAIIVRSEMEVIVCSRASVRILLSIAAETPHLRLLIVIDAGDNDAGDNTGKGENADGNSISAPPATCKCISFTDVEAAGAALVQKQPHLFVEQVRSSMLPTDLATVIFSSGSTGTPKGAMLNEESFRRRICVQYLLPDPCVVISYMPLAHSFDRVNVLSHFVGGGRIAFHVGPVATITDTLQLARPTSFSSTPRLWNALFQEYQHLLQTNVQEVDAAALAAAAASSAGVVDGNADVGFNAVAFTAKLRARAKQHIRGKLGGRVHNIGTGGAHTTPAVLEFMRECFGCSVTDGFGATEAGGIAWDGTVGSKVKTKVLDVVDMGYTSVDQPCPRGELCVSNNALAGGYLNDPSATTAAFFTDEAGSRWYRTGDIVELHPGGNVVLIDRMRALFKLAHGEFVAPQRVEQILETLPLIANCWVTGRAAAEYPIAVIQLDMHAVEAWLLSEASGDCTSRIPSDTNATVQPTPLSASVICEPGSALEHAVLASIKNVGSDSIRAFEMPRAILLEAEPWTVASGLVTGTFKLRRPRLEAKYSAAITELYAKSERTKQATKTIAQRPIGVDDAPTSPNTVLVMLAMQHLQIDDVVATQSDGVTPATTALLLHPLVELLPDSLSAMGFISAVNIQFGTTLAVSVLLEEGATLQHVLDRLLTNDDRSNEVVDFLHEACGADDVIPSFATPVGSTLPPEVKQVVLTGATGFVGAFLLSELLIQLPATCRVVCVVRADTDASALDRIEETLVRYELLTRAHPALVRWKERVLPLAGDLAARNLGLDLDAFVRLGAATDLIVHCGAKVHSLLPYSVLKGPNVLGTVELLKLASIGQKQSGAAFFCHVSTVGVLPPVLISPLLEESTVPPDHLHRANGYSQSKWVAETMVRRAFGRGLRGCIVRPATVFSARTTGAGNPTDFVIRSVRGMVQLGAVPMLSRAVEADLTPVDSLAAAIVGVCTTVTNQNLVACKVLNLTAPERTAMVDLISWLSKYIEQRDSVSGASRTSAGVGGAEVGTGAVTKTDARQGLVVSAAHTPNSLEQLPFKQWQTRLLQHNAAPTPLHPLKEFFSGSNYPAALRVSRSEASSLLAACNVEPLATVDETLALQCFAALDRGGYLPAPFLIN
jgi:fatty acid CoA ligase FadD9